jgi:hypothetical protein
MIGIKKSGGLAQLARALDLHSRGQGFDSLILHKKGRLREKSEKYILMNVYDENKKAERREKWK